jgi:uncharacterized OB-fold protein
VSPVNREPGEGTGIIPLSVAEFEEGIRQGVIRGLLCRRCGGRYAGPLAFCPGCGSSELERVDLSTTGVILSYTIQWVAPEPFNNDAPYAWIVVRLDDGAKITGWIPFVSRPEDLRIGQRVRFTRSYRPGIVFEPL